MSPNCKELDFCVMKTACVPPAAAVGVTYIICIYYSNNKEKNVLDPEASLLSFSR